MPRHARKKTDSGIYHVMLRGINRQQIFLEPEDYSLFLEVLRECKALSGFKLYAYCLMGNHIHLRSVRASGDGSLTIDNHPSFEVLCS